MIVQPKVESALASNRPVVALETAVVTHGLPRDTLSNVPADLGDVWDEARPANQALAVALSALVRSCDACPAVIGVVEGMPTIGLTEVQLHALANDRSAAKASTRDLGLCMLRGANAGTTVAATAHLCAQVSPHPIRVFATGGIGGVHLGWPETIDISADLFQLASTPVCIVCAGAKSILDGRATLEALDALRVPVVGYRTSCFPRFVCAGDDTLPVAHRAESVEEIVSMCVFQWDDVKHPAAVIVCREIDEQQAVNAAVFEKAHHQAEVEASEQSIAGPALTPFLLRRIAELTDGKTLRANLSVLAGNATLAAQIARVFAAREAPQR